LTGRLEKATSHRDVGPAGSGHGVSYSRTSYVASNHK